MALAPCPSCTRHVRVSESACPFCGQAVALEARAQPMPLERLSRAALFAFSASVAMASGCGPQTVEPTPVQPVPTPVAQPEPQPEPEEDPNLGADLYGGPPNDLDHEAVPVPAYGAPPEPPPEEAQPDPPRRNVTKRPIDHTISVPAYGVPPVMEDSPAMAPSAPSSAYGGPPY